MKFNPQKYHRRSIRLNGYDYSQAGAYFVTIDVQNGECLFGEIVNGEMILNEAGNMIDEQWNALRERFPTTDLDICQIMPDHFHGIIVILGAPVKALPAAEDTIPMKSPGLGDMIGAFKSITTHEYILGVDHKSWPRFAKRLWQRNYYEHIIRDEKDLDRIRNYIQANPANWKKGNCK